VLKERGRKRRASRTGVVNVVSAKARRMKDYHLISSYSRDKSHARGTHGIFSRAPESFYDSHVVKRHGCEQHFGGIGVAELVDQDPPYLMVPP
jgi:hypothetical protein